MSNRLNIVSYRYHHPWSFRIHFTNFAKLLLAESATALYDYAGTSSDEISFVEGDRLAIVDSSDASWWKAVKGDVVGIVPASYVQLS